MRENEHIKKDEDHENISLFKKGNIDAFEVLVTRHQKKMFNIAYRMVGSYEEACEIVQDAFVSAYKAINNFEGKSRFSTWLYAIVINLSKNRLKQLKSQHQQEQFSIDDPVVTDDGSIKSDPPSDAPSIVERLEQKDIQKRVQDCINSLDDEFREVVVLRDIHGFAYDEISSMLEVAQGTVKSRLFRARESLKSCLKKYLGEL